jgi:acid stress-induced BolA-like protein IbaG/YrbA
MVTPQYVQSSIVQNLSCTHCEVQGDGQHFEAVIVSAEFAGLRTVQQHQKVYAALGDKMREEIHALSMKTFTPEQWAAETHRA